jgi:hypothetical protein
MSINEQNRKSFIEMVIVLVCFAFSLPQAGAETWLEKQKLTVPDINFPIGWFGHPVSISGDYAIVGANPDENDMGSAYIFKRDGAAWSQQQMLTASDGAIADMFGISVSISGDYAIVGAYADDDMGSLSGSAYIFKRDGTNWIQQAKLTASDGTAGDQFGVSVSISGDYAIVGACLDDVNYTDSGSAYIFKRDGTSWSQQAKLLGTGHNAHYWFGVSVSISDDYAIVGAPDYIGTGMGYAYIFKRDAEVESWSLQAKLHSSYLDPDAFGISVSISGDYAIVGTLLSSGPAYIFKLDGTTWSRQQKLTVSDGGVGGSVAISSDYAMMGTVYGRSPSNGKVYIFRRDASSWSEQQKILVPDSNTEGAFGISVSFSGDYAIFGAGRSAYLFTTCPSADLGGDCFVNFADFAVFGGQWLQSPGVPSADIAPLPNGDGIVDFLDLEIFADEWLYGTD